MVDRTENTFYPPEPTPKNDNDDEFGYPGGTEGSK